MRGLSMICHELKPPRIFCSQIVDGKSMSHYFYVFAIPVRRIAVLAIVFVIASNSTAAAKKITPIIPPSHLSSNL